MNDTGAAAGRFQAHARRLDTMVRDLETLPYPRIRDRVSDILRTVDALHREPLERLIDLLKKRAPDGLLERIHEDESIRGLLLLYDLVPGDEIAQVEAALDPVRTRLHPYESDVEVLSIVDGEVHVRLHGSCSDCPASAEALRNAVDSALQEGFPGYRSVHVHSAPPQGAPEDGEPALLDSTADDRP